MLTGHSPPLQAFEDSYKDRWLECARRAFAELDAGGSGALGAAEIASAFGSHLSPYEVDAGEGGPGGPPSVPTWHEDLAGWHVPMQPAGALEACSYQQGRRVCAHPPACVAAVHQALLEATGGRAAMRASAAAGAGDGAWPAAAGGGEDDAEPHIDFDRFLCMLREQSGDLDKFDDRWAGCGRG